MIESGDKPKQRDISPEVEEFKDDMLDITEYDGPDPTEDFDGGYRMVFDKKTRQNTTDLY